MSGQDATIWHDSARAHGGAVNALYERCQAAYHAFDELPKLVDHLRILAVNAELASARAGDHGRAVRVLTQFAVECVTRLMGLVPELVGLKKRTYGLAGGILRAASDIAKLEAAGARVMNAGTKDALLVLDGAWRARLAELAIAAAQLTLTHNGLVDIAKAAREVMMQTEIISANIAIESTSAGPFEAELRAIADTMRGRVDELRAMIDGAARALRSAAETNHALAAFGAAGR
ncbi:MAG: chemotaxis protein [Rhodospirillaceae bacterium]|nr:chemotaxis protein [Rhodospirillales bacterium]